MRLIGRGGYILRDSGTVPQLIVIATGSEVALALQAVEQLDSGNIRVVSMPCTDLFDAQDEEYREHVLPSGCRNRLVIEAGIPDYWRKYCGLDGSVIGVPGFGESAPAADVYRHFGITVEGVTAAIRTAITAVKN